MCRLFGFRSVIQSQVHQSLLNAENALAVQSQQHRDGWGVSYYLADTPHVIKSIQTAIEDQIFRRVSGVVASNTVLGHVRKATHGEVNILNAHPFQHGRWVFAHNGTVNDFEKHRDALLNEIAPNLRRYILGDTDSELLFYLFLTHLSQMTDLHRRGTPIESVASALAKTVCGVREIADQGAQESSSLTLMTTEGQTMVALCSGKELHYSTHKKRCVDHDTCPYLAQSCEALTDSGFVNHLILSSEPLQGDNIWFEMTYGDIVGVDWRMGLYHGTMKPCGSTEVIQARPVAPT
jgi:glutamine amidotransferase